MKLNMRYCLNSHTESKFEGNDGYSEFFLHGLPQYYFINRFDVKKASDHWAIQSGVNAVKVFANPFRIEVFANEEKVTVINGRNTLKFEHLRLKPDA